MPTKTGQRMAFIVILVLSSNHSTMTWLEHDDDDDDAGEERDIFYRRRCGVRCICPLDEVRRVTLVRRPLQQLQLCVCGHFIHWSSSGTHN